MTVWGDDEERSKKITEYYTDVLNKIGLNAKPKIIGAETYFQTIGDFEGVNPVTMFDDWFQDFPHPGDFFFLLESGSIQPTNNQNHSVVRDKKVDQLAEEIKAEAPGCGGTGQGAGQVRNRTRRRLRAGVWSHKETTFVSERMDFENCTVFHPVYRDDWSQFCLK